jgi:uncharacterized protein (TIGR02001 family)
MALRAFGLALATWAGLVVPTVAADLVPVVKAADPNADDELAIEIDAFVTSDYVYRGVSLSSRKPSAGTTIDVEWHGFFSNTNFQSVSLPTNPALEITQGAGYRWKWDKFEFELGANYFYYPGEIIPPGGVKTSYFEYAFDVKRKFLNFVELDLNAAYSPNVSGSGAWGSYVEGGATFDLGRFMTFKDLTWQLAANAGYSRFGSTSPAQGGFPLPAYANWHLGLTFLYRQNLSVDLSYYDTNLSKEDCFVFTGDTMATPGGVPNPVNNPDGLQSRLCGAAFVGTLKVTFDPLAIGQ